MKSIKIFISTIVIMLVTVSCQKQDYGCGSDTNVLFKYNDENYSNYIAVLCSENSNRVSGYPDTSDAFTMGLNYYPIKCSNGFYFNSLEGFSLEEHLKHIGFTNITEDEYKEIWKICKNIPDTLKSRIIDRDPYKEIYTLPYDDVLYMQGNLNIDTINALIESGEFFTHEGVTRIK